MRTWRPGLLMAWRRGRTQRGRWAAWSRGPSLPAHCGPTGSGGRRSRTPVRGNLRTADARTVAALGGWDAGWRVTHPSDPIRPVVPSCRPLARTVRYGVGVANGALGCGRRRVLAVDARLGLGLFWATTRPENVGKGHLAPLLAGPLPVIVASDEPTAAVAAPLPPGLRAAGPGCRRRLDRRRCVRSQ